MRQPKPGTASVGGDHLPHGSPALADRDGGARLAQLEQLGLGGFEVDLGLAGGSVVEDELDGCRRRASRRSTRAMRAPASSGPRIISSTQRIFWPTTTVEIPSPAVVRTTWVGHAAPSSTATRCTGPSPGSGTATIPARERAVLLTTMVDDGGASMVVAS